MPKPRAQDDWYPPEIHGIGNVSPLDQTVRRRPKSKPIGFVWPTAKPKPKQR